MAKRPVIIMGTSNCQEYVTLHDYFGRGVNDAMKRLKGLRAEVLAK
jgi:hypothetical protein